MSNIHKSTLTTSVTSTCAKPVTTDDNIYVTTQTIYIKPVIAWLDILNENNMAIVCGQIPAPIHPTTSTAQYQAAYELDSMDLCNQVREHYG